MLAMAYLLVFMRMAVRISERQSHLILSDALLVAGARCALGIIICDTIFYRAGAMDDYDMNALFMSDIEIDKA